MEEEIIRTIFISFGILVAAALTIYLITRLIKLISRQKKIIEHKKGILIKVVLPRYPHPLDQYDRNSKNPDNNENAAEQFFSELRSIVPDDIKQHFDYFDTLSFEILATAEEIGFYIFCTKRYLSLIKKAVYGAHPEAEITEVSDYVDSITNQPFQYGYIRCTGPAYAPIRTYDTFKNDTLNTLLSKMTNLKGDEKIAIQFYITPTQDKWRKAAHSALKNLANSGSDSTVWKGNQDQLVVDQQLYKGIEDKMSKKGYSIGIRILSTGPRPVARSNIRNVGHTFAQFEMPPVSEFQTTFTKLNSLRFTKNYKLRLRPFIDLPIYKQQFVANTKELATLFHFPNAEIRVPKIAWQIYKKEPAPSDIPDEGTFLGYNTFRDKKTPIYVSQKDRRRHFYIIGQTGVGKSEYMKNMFLQDVYNGHGACFLDPHGDVAEDILTKIPADRLDDVIYWNPGDTKYPIGFNIMDVETEEHKNIIINSFIALLYKLYDPNRVGMMGPMLERTVRNVMLTAMSQEGSTLVETLRLIIDEDYAKEMIPDIEDPIVKSYWTEQMAKTTDFHKSEALGYYVSKFDRFVTDRTIRNIIGQSKSAIDFREVMDQQKLLIINLSKGILGVQNMSFLGMVIIPHILVAAMSRADMPEKERKDFYLYVDEFQNFATKDFISILSEARKYRLNLIMGNQYISQIREKVRNAVFGNVGSIGAFRVSVDDAEYLVNQFYPIFNKFDLTNNAIGNMYIKLLVDGKPSKPFTVGLDWEEVQNVPVYPSHSSRIINNSRNKYAEPREVVEQKIKERAQLENLI